MPVVWSRLWRSQRTGSTWARASSARSRRRYTRGVKEQLVRATERDTELIFRPLRNTAPVACNGVSRRVVEILDQGGQCPDVRELVAGQRGRRVYETGDLEAGIWSVGMVQALIHDIPTVAELVDRIVTEAAQLIRERLGGLLVV